MESQSEELRRVAYHEAGHAVVIYALDWRIKSVSIRPRYDLKSCYLSGSAGRANFNYEPREKESALDVLENAVAISLAGIVAEKNACGGFKLQGGKSDFENVERTKGKILHIYTTQYPPNHRMRRQ